MPADREVRKETSVSADVQKTKTDVWSYECPCCYASYDPDNRPADGRCVRCDESPNLRERQSEFGAGLVVCLAKFSEHLWQRREQDIYTYARWIKLSEAQRQRERSEAGQHPRGDAAERMAVIKRFKFDEEGFHKYPSLSAGCETPEEYAIHQAISMWANAAGDHFFDLDEERAPQPLRDLADLVIRMRNTHLTDAPLCWKVEDMDRVRELWRESCVALDRMLGTVPNWGEY
jgi:hypothetical protein